MPFIAVHSTHMQCWDNDRYLYTINDLSFLMINDPQLVNQITQLSSETSTLLIVPLVPWLSLTNASCSAIIEKSRARIYNARADRRETPRLALRLLSSASWNWFLNDLFLLELPFIFVQLSSSTQA
jgi:hypothetical protein